MTETETEAPPLARSFKRPVEEELPPLEETAEEDAPVADSSGWNGYARVRAATSDFANLLKIADKTVVVKILDSEPFDTYASHWIDDMPEGHQKSIRCWGDKKLCPLCRTGDKTNRFASCLNVVAFEDIDNPAAEPMLKVFEAGAKISEALKLIAQDPRKGPINRPDLYFSISKVTKGKKTEYTIERVRSADLYEEYGVTPLTDEAVAKFAADVTNEPTSKLLDRKGMADVIALLD